MAENNLTMSPDYNGYASELSDSRISSDSEATFSTSQLAQIIAVVTNTGTSIVVKLPLFSDSSNDKGRSVTQKNVLCLLLSYYIH